MSRAFVKESEPDAPIDLPDRPVSSVRNLMTEAGYKAIKALQLTLKHEIDQLSGSEDFLARTRIAELNRDLRYYNQRLQSAEIVPSPHTDAVRFGHWIVFNDEEGGEYCFQIVGEDEADVAERKISWASPLANALIGQSLGDTCCWRREGREMQIEIIAISKTQPA
ncbi:MAG: GreA/GreB family elongation factor [bacterium]